MTRSLTGKLTLAFSLVALTVALLVAVFIRVSSAGQLDRLIIEQLRNDYKTRLSAYYQTNGSWAGVREYFDQLRQEQFPVPTHEPDGTPSAGERSGGPPRDRRQLFGVADTQGVIVIPLFTEFLVGAQVPPNVLAQGDAIEVNGQVVGTILTASRPPGLNPEEAAYLGRTNSALLLASGGALIVALLMGILLARTLTRPLHALTEATHRMAGGELEQAVRVQSADEIGELAKAFNRMSQEVARAHKVRRQMTADVAHELRTPLTVIAGYIESMRDGVLAPTPERLRVIYAEIEHLQDLVGDLRTLSLADAGELKLNKQPVALGELLEQMLATFEHQAAQKGVSLELKAEREIPAIGMDETRMAQVLGNLISNALRFTPAGGRITLGASRTAAGVALTVADTGEGIAPADLPLIFNRFYRADQARTEENGESGLGLAIVKALVEAHGGDIAVDSVLGGGSTFTISLPSAASR